MRLLFQKLLNGIAIGSVYALFALGYTIVFSILRVINFAHGAIFTVGAYLTYALTGAAFGRNGQLRNASLPLELNFWIALTLGALGAGVLGVIVERLAFKPLRKRGSDPLLTLVSSLGVAIATVNILQYLFGAENYSFGETLGSMRASVTLVGGELPVVIRTKQIVIFAVSMVHGRRPHPAGQSHPHRQGPAGGRRGPHHRPPAGHRHRPAHPAVVLHLRRPRRDRRSPHRTGGQLQLPVRGEPSG